MNNHFLFTQASIEARIPMPLQNKLIKVLILVTIFLFTFINAYSQDSLNTGMFDINSTVTAISKSALVEADGFGESSYLTEKLSNGNLKVRFTYNKVALPNPLFITYAYEIEKLPSGDFAMDMQAAMPPLSLYIDTNTLALSYIGDKIILPNHLLNENRLSDVNGAFSLKNTTTNSILLTYEVAVTNRQFTKKGNITLNGKTYEAYTHTYSFVQKTFLDGNTPFYEWQDTVEETYLVGYGIVNQKRQGQQIPINVHGGQVTEQKLISELLNVK